MAFIDEIKAKAKSNKKTVILPESMDRRTFEAAAEILAEDIANLIIIGTDEEVKANSEGLDISKATIINPHTYEKTQEYINGFYELRKAKGMTPEEAEKTLLGDYMYYA
ncbi:MAG: phosphate acetyltransferase, partial [Clostridiales bacterium]|nr:phosphate acetyltransferase [Clostridiales bacterium]